MLRSDSDFDSKGNRIILVSELFYPEESATAYIMTKIANRLSINRDVEVLTGPASYESEATRITNSGFINPRITIKRVWSPVLDKNNLLHRVFRAILTSVLLTVFVFRRARKGDVVFSVTNPAPLVFLLGIAKKIKGFRFCLLVHDVFPENTVPAGLANSGSMKYRFVKFVFDKAYASADRIITIGRDMADVIKAKIGVSSKSEVLTIDNWAELDKISPIDRKDSLVSDIGIEDKVVILYAGNIGRVQGLLEFVQLTTKVVNENLYYLFSGSGALRNELQIELAKIKNARLLGSYSRSEQEKMLGSCDIALIVLRPGMYGLGVPSKVYNIMASGRPILYIGETDSEVYRLIREHKIGWAFDWRNVDDILRFMNNISGKDIDNFKAIPQRSRQIAEQFFNEDVSLDKFSDVIVFN